MAYTKPDVFVSVLFEGAAVALDTPLLLPVAVGPHFHVARNAFAGNFDASVSATIPYPKLPNSWNRPDIPLAVDIDSMWAPQATMVLAGSGEEVDITEMLSYQADQILKPVFTDDYNGEPYTGAIYVTYRALSDQYSGVNRELLRASGPSELTELFGPDALGPANPLGFAMQMMLLQAGVAVGGVAIGALPDASGQGRYESAAALDEVSAYAYALEELEKFPEVQQITPLTQSDYVLDVVLTHCNAMSSYSGRSERRMLFTPSMSPYWPVRGEDDQDVYFAIRAQDASGALLLNDSVDAADPETAIGYEHEVSEGSNTYRILRIEAGDGLTYGTFVLNGYNPSTTDEVLMIGGNQYNVTYLGSGTTRSAWVKFSRSLFQPQANRVRIGDSLGLENTTEEAYGIIASTGVAGVEELARVEWTGDDYPSTDDIASQRFRVFRFKRDRERAEGLALMAESYGSERLTMVAPATLGFNVNGTNLDLPSYYAAAQLGAEMCLVGRRPAGAAPGAFPLTAVRDPFFTPFLSSRYFTEAELDLAAGGGVTFLVNTQPGGPLTSRHTLSTDMSDIRRREAILGVERDFLAKTFRLAFRDRLTKSRIDESLLNTLQIEATAIATGLTRVGSPRRSFRSISIESIEQDPVQPDKVTMQVRAVHLYVFNYLDVVITIPV